MKSAGTNTLAALSSGQFYKAELYDIALTSGATLRFTSYDLPLSLGATAYPSNLIVRRGSISQRVGLESQSLDLELAPQADAVSAPTVGGLPFLQAVRQGFFDGARVTMRKVFMAVPASGLPVNTNGESVVWFVGTVADANAGRQMARLTVESDLARLNIQMPRNVLQPGCVHSLFDGGCTLVKATWTQSGTVSATGPNTSGGFTTGLTQATDFYSLGVITFTSGANSGLSRTVRSHSNTSGALVLVSPFPSAPATGDTFTIVPGCDKQQATCSGKFSNLVHFRGFPYVPVPETLYDGGSVTAPAPQIGGQGTPGYGSYWPANLYDGGYIP